ncbi:AgmX/PglI C-terminal domain-containing protein [bacterium]|nr:AgmX/PglI C-terminal domain-containing protein [bacterium]
MSRDLIDAVIKLKMSQIKYCYQRELQNDPSLAGKVVVQFTIKADGTVDASSVKIHTTTLNSPAVEKAILDRFKLMTFPESSGVTVVKYPFIFSPGN